MAWQKFAMDDPYNRSMKSGLDPDPLSRLIAEQS